MFIAATYVAIITTAQAASVLGPAEARPGKPPPLARHKPIDVDFAPRVGDRVLLGTWDRDAPEQTINRAWCYSSLESLRESLAYTVVVAADCTLDPGPEYYCPRTGTAAIVTRTELFSARVDGRPRKGTAFRVQVAEGEFKGKELWVGIYSIFRYSEGATRDSK